MSTDFQLWLISAFPWLIIGIPILILVAFGAWWLWWRLPKRQAYRLRLTVRDAKARAEIEDNLRKTIGQLLAGAAVLLGAVFAYLQFQQQQRSARELMISNQVSRGFEHLGSDQFAIRLGGIYALEGVMNTSAQYQQPVLEALCAFVRERAKNSVNANRRPAVDIQAALTVIGRRASGPGSPDLSGAVIRSADLRSADLTDANLRSADLRSANLGSAKLSGTDLTAANLLNANLSGADLRGTDLTAADLRRANLGGADLRGTNLVYADLRGALLHGANLGIADLNFADIRGAILYDASLRGAVLRGADLGGVELDRADLRDAKDLTKQQLSYACGDSETKLPEGFEISECKIENLFPPTRH